MVTIKNPDITQKTKDQATPKEKFNIVKNFIAKLQKIDLFTILIIVGVLIVIGFGVKMI